MGPHKATKKSIFDPGGMQTHNHLIRSFLAINCLSYEAESEQIVG